MVTWIYLINQNKLHPIEMHCIIASLVTVLVGPGTTIRRLHASGLRYEESAGWRADIGGASLSSIVGARLWMWNSIQTTLGLLWEFLANSCLFGGFMLSPRRFTVAVS